MRSESDTSWLNWSRQYADAIVCHALFFFVQRWVTWHQKCVLRLVLRMRWNKKRWKQDLHFHRFKRKMGIKDISKAKNYFGSIFFLAGLKLASFDESEGESLRSLSSFSLICRTLRELVAMPAALSRKLFMMDVSLCAYNEPHITGKVSTRIKKLPVTLTSFII